MGTWHAPYFVPSLSPPVRGLGGIIPLSVGSPRVTHGCMLSPLRRWEVNLEIRAS